MPSPRPTEGPEDPPILVSPGWLAARLYDPSLRIVDIRGKVMPPGSPPPRYRPQREAYDEEHVPGAVFVDWTRDIVDTDDPIPSQLASPEAFASAMGRLGIGNDTLVVAYDDYSHMFAGRLRWALRYYGHDRVVLLEGGFPAWKLGGFPTTRDVPTPTPAAFVPHPRTHYRKTADDVESALARGALVIDARPSPQYRGEQSAASRAGHIPGAVNVPYPSLLEGPQGKFRAPEELRVRFRNVGIDLSRPPSEIIVYCNGGISATVPLTALEMLGVPSVSLYDGSWNEWGNDPTRPIEVEVDKARTP